MPTPNASSSVSPKNVGDPWKEWFPHQRKERWIHAKPMRLAQSSGEEFRGEPRLRSPDLGMEIWIWIFGISDIRIPNLNVAIK